MRPYNTSPEPRFAERARPLPIAGQKMRKGPGRDPSQGEGMKMNFGDIGDIGDVDLNLEKCMEPCTLSRERPGASPGSRQEERAPPSLIAGTRARKSPGTC